MLGKTRSWLLGGILLLAPSGAMAQTTPAAQTPAQGAQPPPPMPAELTIDPPPPLTAVAARVNGQNVPEMAVYRGLLSMPPQVREQARKDVLNHLIENTIIDQYLNKLNIPVDAKEVDGHVQKIKSEAAKDKQDFTKLLGKLHLTEDDLRRELTSALRWDKFVLQQGTDKALQGLFEKNVDMFDGSRVQARHILIPLTGGKEAAQAKAVALKKHIEADVAQQLSKLPSSTDALAREKERTQILDKTFADYAVKESSCPSGKKQGGDLGYFPRVGHLVEPFAKVAFALKPYQLSDPVATEFGYHLILALDHRPGKEVKFADVKPYVLEVYSERLREAILTQYKPRSEIVIVEKKKD
jgi:peptidyl-prolyl cis-trans isomerase C